jgi:peptidoglycan/LPS O-acetylase OafA/YrhL
MGVGMTPTSGRRLVLLAVAALLTGAAALAIGVLLFGDFDETEGRILATTAVLAGYSLLALPAAILRDQRRLPALAAVVLALTAAAATLAIAGIWTDEPGEAFGKALGTVNGWLVASVQIAALALRRSERDPRSVRWLFGVSSSLVILLATMLTVVIWAEIDSEGFGRVFGALLVLNVLLVVLQPVLARIRPAGRTHLLRVVVAPQETVDLTIEAVDVAAAASKAIGMLEPDGRRVLHVSFVDRGGDAGVSGRRGDHSTPGAASSEPIAQP